jgi:hypothetical protein
MCARRLEFCVGSVPKSARAAAQVFEILFERCEAKKWSKPLLTVLQQIIALPFTPFESAVNADGTQTVDGAGNVPLHYAVRHAAARDVVKLMLRTCDDLVTGAKQWPFRSFTAAAPRP